MKNTSLSALLSWATIASLAATAPAVVQAQAIQIAEVTHEGPVDFEKEILPLFRRNCLACHSATEAQSDLVLETPQTLLKGGSNGPAVVAGKGAESLLIKLAAKQLKPVMPPEDNDVKAKPFTPQELGLIKKWIDEGAKGDVKGGGGAITWQALPPGVQPIYAVAITDDGQYAAAARANQIFLYHVPSKRELGRLTDPALIERGLYKNPGVADVDLVQSLAFNPEGTLLASGGFRSVKLWRKPEPAKKLDLTGLESPARSLVVSPDGKWAAIGEENGKIDLFNLENGQIAKRLEGHAGAVKGLCFSADSTQLVSGSADKKFKIWNLADGKEILSIETPTPVNAVALVMEEKQIVTAGEDNNWRLWDRVAAAPAEVKEGEPKPEGEAAPAEAPKPVKEVGGNGAPINVLVAINKGTQLVSGGKDSQVKLWDVASGNQLKQISAQGPVEAIAVHPTGKSVAAVVGTAVRLFNLESTQPQGESKGNFRVRLAADAAVREVALAKRNVDSAKKDLEEGKKRLTSEQENEKKSNEAMTKADGEFKAKDEAMKKPVADKDEADKALTAATERKTKAEADKKASDEGQKASADAFTKATQERDATNKAATDAAAVATDAATKLAQAKDALSKDAENQGLKDAVAAAEKASQEAEAKKKVADDLKVAMDKVFADAETAKKAADEKKAAADKEMQEAQNVFNQAEQKQKQVAPVAQKAVDERNAAERAFQAAQRAVERAIEAVKKATEAVPALEKIATDFEAVHKQREEAQAAAQKAVPESEKPFHCVAFAPDGATFAVVGDDGLIYLHDGETAAPISAFGPGNAPLSFVAYAATGKLIAAAANNTVTSWDYATEWKLERTIGSPDSTEAFVDRVTALDFSPDGKRLATGSGEPSRSGEIKIWDATSGTMQVAFPEPHSDIVTSLEFSPDGTFLASSGADRFVKMFQATDGKFLRSFEGHTHHVLGVSWRADGRLLVSSGADNVLKVWDTRTGDQQRTVQGFSKEVASVQFVGNSDMVVVAAGDKQVKMINANDGGNARNFGGMTDFVYTADASADGKAVIAGGGDSVVRIWKEDGQTLVNFDPPAPPMTAAVEPEKK